MQEKYIRARKLRNNMTEQEKKLWYYLRKRLIFKNFDFKGEVRSNLLRTVWHRQGSFCFNMPEQSVCICSRDCGELGGGANWKKENH